ncbi:MAG: hypothetical protein CM1200mP28_05570 [Deltaproteobacteria bacterium]|nr:MAG: hypothetical protein CM1200mP28_05570 [Deltaproteobacteria bacterium]
MEDLTRQDISIDVGLDMLESSAKTLKDVITINVCVIPKRIVSGGAPVPDSVKLKG